MIQLNEQLQTQKERSSSFSKGVISSHLQQLGYPKKSIDNFNRCGQLTGEYIRVDCGCGTVHKELTYHCSLRTCPTCSKIRKRRIFKEYYPLINNLEISKKRFLYFLTISPRNYDENFSIEVKEKKKVRIIQKKGKKKGRYVERWINSGNKKTIYGVEAGMEHIKRSFDNFIRNKYISEQLFERDENGKIKKGGGFYVIETKTINKFNEAKGYHIHLHALIYGRWLDNRIRGKCNKCKQSLIKSNSGGQSFYCANKKCNNKIERSEIRSYSKIQEIYENISGRTARMDIGRLKNNAKLLNYVLKYVSANKDEFSNEIEFAKYIKAINKKKLINKFGNFYNNPESKKKKEIIKNFIKKKYVCYVCHQDIYYTFGRELEKYVNENKKPPYNINNYL